MLRVGVVTSNRAPGLDDLQRHPLRGSLFEIECVLNRRPPKEKSLREWYDRETADLLKPFRLDLVVLLGYLFVVTDPMLDAFPDRIINVHDGVQKYTGLHATRNAIIAGETETRSIVHVVTRELDRGPVLAQSEPMRVAPFVHRAVAAGEMDIVRAYAYAHREWMMRSSWGELIVEAFVRVLEEVPA
ncbi:MAG TPA: formyltransferase family protein [Thermoanaerobaculia bacterium]